MEMIKSAFSWKRFVCRLNVTSVMTEYEPWMRSFPPSFHGSLVLADA